ncbi:GrpB family protein [Pontibacillus yanchengensis]|uniref:GrpB family protein n=1 Tax=Pontibacillus yanchengensis TaxID=462910 RepID=A0A6I4ZWF3_9BACI|nr:GrpB family protein [Pontibacillus yanchengensis]MYL32657.1 GrpB family protein [Pontibacillus yanchengensis]
MRKVEIVPYKSEWKKEFIKEKNLLSPIFSTLHSRIHHIGSTSVPGLAAKPIIDILIEVFDINEVDQLSYGMAVLGYEAKGEHGIPKRRFFFKNENGRRTHHIHVFERDTEDVIRHLCFRNYLVAHPEKSQEYMELKERLAEAYPENIDAYMDGKHDWVQEHERIAIEWSQREL